MNHDDIRPHDAAARTRLSRNRTDCATCAATKAKDHRPARKSRHLLWSWLAALVTLPTFAQTCNTGVPVSCANDQTIVEYKHVSGVHVYLICAEDKASVAKHPTLISTTGRTIDSTGVTDTAVKRGLQRYLFQAKPGQSFSTRHFYTAITKEQTDLESTSPPEFAICKEGTAGSFAAPLLSAEEQINPNPSYQLASCAIGQRPIWRLFRNAEAATSAEPVQHRLTDSFVEVNQLRVDGYTDEYIRICTGDETYRLATSITPLSSTALAAGGTARYRVTVNASDTGVAGAQSGTLVFAWPSGVQAAVVNPTVCTSHAQRPDTGSAVNTRLVCVFQTTSTTPLSIDIDLTAAADFNATASPLLRAAATTRVEASNAAAAAGIATATDIGACVANNIPAYPCATLSTAAVAPDATQLFTIKSLDVTNVSSGTPQIAATLQATLANRDYVTNIYHKLSSEATWTRVAGSRPRSVSGDQVLAPSVALAADRRGTGALRFCAGSLAPASPGTTGVGPADPACRESAVFTTPPLASTTFTVGAPQVSGESTGTISASAVVTSTASGVTYYSSVFYRLAGSSTWTLLQATSAASNGSTQSATLSGYTVPSDLRGTGYIRTCASTAALASPDNVGVGPADPACAESAAFTTPPVNTQPTLQISINKPTVTGADTTTALLTVSVDLSSNRSGVDVFRRLFYRTSGGAWAAVTNATRTVSNGGLQSFTFTYSVPDNQRGAATVAVCAGSSQSLAAATLDTAGAGPGDPVCATSDAFTTPSASPPINQTLAAPTAAPVVGQPAVWSFTVAAVSATVNGPVYLDLALPANWTFASATLPGQALTCGTGASSALKRCTLLASGGQLTTTAISGTITLTPNAGSGGTSGTLVARASTSATAPSAAFTCAVPNDTACASASATPQYVDLKADSPLPNPINLPASSSSVALTCSNAGTRPTPATAFCRIEVVYTDSTTQMEPPAGQDNWADASATKQAVLCGSTVTPATTCLLALDANKTVRTITVRAGQGTGAATEPDNNAGNDALTVYDNTPPSAPSVDVSALPQTGNVGTAYSGSFACTGSTGLQSFTCGIDTIATPLPAGLQVGAPCADTTTGTTRTLRCTVSGTPTAGNTPAGQTVTIKASSSNATPATVTADRTITITAGLPACPAIPAGAEKFDQITDAPRVITIMGLNPGLVRYIKLTAGPWWATESDYLQYGYLGGTSYIIPRLPPTWHGIWALSRCPGDVTSTNVMKSTTAGFNFYWYGMPVGATARPAPSNNDASGLPGLLVPESQGGQSWYLNFRTDTCDVPGVDGCRASYQIF